MKKTLFGSCLAAVSALSLLVGPSAQASTTNPVISDSGNLREKDSELFKLFNSTVNAESLALEEKTLPELVADSLRWDGIADSIDVVFINEGAGFRNQLLFSLNEGPQKLLFNDIASTESILKENQGSLDWKQNRIDQTKTEINDLEAALKLSNLTEADRTAKEKELTDKKNSLKWQVDTLAIDKTLGNNGLGTMRLGDSKSIGGLLGDVSVDFFVKADGARRESGKIYGADASKNADGLQHVIAREFRQDNENWVLLGFEDLYGVHKSQGGWSDRDFNDVVIAVRGVTGDRVKPEEVPEPMAVVGLIFVGALGLTQKRRQQTIG